MAQKKTNSTHKYSDPKPIFPGINTAGIDLANKPKYRYPPEHRFMLCPKADSELDMLADDLILWAQQPDSLAIGGFANVSGMTSSSLYGFAERHARLAQAISIAKEIIGYRREYGALLNLLNPYVVMGTKMVYDPEFKSIKKELAASKDGSGEGIKVNVVMERYPETEVVPLKEEKND